MSEQIGIIIENEKNDMARVLTDRRGACGGCHSGAGKCRSCLTTSAKLESHVINPIGARPGDVVKIFISPTDLFRGAAIMYLLPVATLLLGAAGGFYGWGDTGSVLGGLAGLAIGFWAVTRLGRSHRLSRKMTPTITAIVTPSTEPAKPVVTPCCG